jgi:hypothetical protein
LRLEDIPRSAGVSRLTPLQTVDGDGDSALTLLDTLDFAAAKTVAIVPLG